MKREELCGKYFATPTEGIWDAVIKMLKDAGFKTAYGMYWNGHADILGKTGPSYLCILGGEGSFPTGLIGYTSRGWFEESNDYSKVSLTELTDILAKPKYTLMTSDELNKRAGSELNEELAFELSIDKWERCMEDGNWHAMGNDLTFIGESTCGLCLYWMKSKFEGGLKKCSDCPLGIEHPCGHPNHPWNQALEALKRRNGEDFDMYGKELLRLMRDALNELRKPKRTYRIGQWFRNDGNLFLLARSINSSEVSFTCAKDGNIWHAPEKVKDTHKVTEEELAKIIGSSDFMDYGEFVPVDVDITVKGENK